MEPKLETIKAEQLIVFSSLQPHDDRLSIVAGSPRATTCYITRADYVQQHQCATSTRCFFVFATS